MNEERIDDKTFKLHKDLIMDYLEGRIKEDEFKEMHSKLFPQPKDSAVEKIKDLVNGRVIGE